jgi:nitrate reductase assembly molybdenum cofactor insertion protein NarJ
MGAATRTEVEVWDAFAGMLGYPGGHAETLVEQWAPLVSARFPKLVGELAPLVSLASSRGEGECEELYTRTFDGSAERALELGWHLHGENYARGVLLVRLRAMLREARLDEGGELPDHVSNVLRLLGRADDVAARALIENVLAPALDKAIDGFAPKEAAGRAGERPDEPNPYHRVLLALREALRDHPARRSAA